MSKMPETEEELLAIDRRLMGFAALSNFGSQCSSSRYVMFSNFLGQYIPLEHGEPKIILSGVEKEFVKTLFGRKVKNDSRILGIIDRYDGKTVDRVNQSTEKFILYHDLVLDEINYINIPIYEKFSPKFGFSHREDPILDELEYGDEISSRTKLSRTNSENDDGDLCIGLNVNMCLASFKEGGEDAIVISDTLAKRGAFKTYETVKAQFGIKDLPLNLYGDDDNYKIMPDIGERVHESGILLATRHVHDNNDESMLPALMSRRHLAYQRPIFDNCVYVKDNTGVVIDIKVVHTPKIKKASTYTHIDEQMWKYVDSLSDFNKKFISTVETIQKDYEGTNTVIGDKLHKMMVDLYCVQDPKLVNIMSQEPLDLFMIEFTIEYNHELKIGTKMSGIYGDKGIVSKIIPEKDMPIDGNGIRADAIMDHKSVNSRMNAGKLFDGYVTTTSRMVQKYVREHSKVLDNKTVDHLWDYILGYLSILEVDQYQSYKSVTSMTDKKEVIKEIIEKEFYVMFPIDNKKRARLVVEDLDNSIYKLTKTPIKFNIEGVAKETTDPVAIETVYMLVLSKIADTWLATSTGKNNHFGVPISTSKNNKKRQPWSPNPVKTGETETRLYSAYVGREALAELRDRSASIETHKHMYRNILKADKPTRIDKVIDRNIVGFNNDKPVKLMESILNVGGVEIVFDEEREE